MVKSIICNDIKTYKRANILILPKTQPLLLYAISFFIIIKNTFLFFIIIAFLIVNILAFIIILLLKIIIIITCSIINIIIKFSKNNQKKNYTNINTEYHIVVKNESKKNNNNIKIVHNIQKHHESFLKKCEQELIEKKQVAMDTPCLEKIENKEIPLSGVKPSGVFFSKIFQLLDNEINAPQVIIVAPDYVLSGQSVILRKLLSTRRQNIDILYELDKADVEKINGYKRSNKISIYAACDVSRLLNFIKQCPHLFSDIKLLIIDNELDIIKDHEPHHCIQSHVDLLLDIDQYKKIKFKEESTELKIILKKLSKSIQICSFSPTLKNEIEALSNPKETEFFKWLEKFKYYENNRQRIIKYHNYIKNHN